MSLFSALVSSGGRATRDKLVFNFQTFLPLGFSRLRFDSFISGEFPGQGDNVLKEYYLLVVT
jgi:hypothetical protein